MKITQIRTTPLALPLREPYHWAGRVDTRVAVILIEVETDAGILGIGALVLGAKVTFLEIDESLKEVIEANITVMQGETDNDLSDYEIIIADATEAPLPAADLILTNPPFGTKEKHANTRLVERAFQNSNECYSFHKSATNTYLQDWFRQRNITIVQEFPFTFDLPATMRQHEKKSHNVQITCWHTRKDL